MMGGVVRLRPTAPSDIPVFFQHQLDDAARHMAAFTSKEPPERSAFDAKWARQLAHPAILSRTVLVDERVVGHVSSFPLGDEIHLTYWIAREAWGRGVATRAVALFLREAKERPIFASAAGDNVGSIRVLERSGFRRTGSARAHAPARAGVIEEAFFVLDA